MASLPPSLPLSPVLPPVESLLGSLPPVLPFSPVPPPVEGLLGSLPQSLPLGLVLPPVVGLLGSLPPAFPFSPVLLPVEGLMGSLPPSLPLSLGAVYLQHSLSVRCCFLWRVYRATYVSLSLSQLFHLLNPLQQQFLQVLSQVPLQPIAAGISQQPNIQIQSQPLCIQNNP